MGRRFTQTVSSGSALATLCAAMLFAGTAGSFAGERTASIGGGAAMPNERAIYETVGGETRAPIGWVEFCVEYKPECNTKPSTPRDVVLSTKAWSDLIKVNAWVNDTVNPSPTSTIGAWWSAGVIPTTARATVKITSCSSAAS